MCYKKGKVLIHPIPTHVAIHPVIQKYSHPNTAFIVSAATVRFQAWDTAAAF